MGCEVAAACSHLTKPDSPATKTHYLSIIQSSPSVCPLPCPPSHPRPPRPTPTHPVVQALALAERVGLRPVPHHHQLLPRPRHGHGRPRQGQHGRLHAAVRQDAEEPCRGCGGDEALACRAGPCGT